MEGQLAIHSGRVGALVPVYVSSMLLIFYAADHADAV